MSKSKSINDYNAHFRVALERIAHQRYQEGRYQVTGCSCCGFYLCYTSLYVAKDAEIKRCMLCNAQWVETLLILEIDLAHHHAISTVSEILGTLSTGAFILATQWAFEVADDLKAGSIQSMEWRHFIKHVQRLGLQHKRTP